MPQDQEAAVHTDPADRPTASDAPHVLCDVHELLAETAAPPGVVWKLARAGRQLDANLVQLSPEQVIGTHTERDLDVLVIVLAGTATLTTSNGPLSLAAGALVWLPHGSTRTLTAGPNGASYLTVHQRRPGMRIRVGP